jgi:hypothetical protein
MNRRERGGAVSVAVIVEQAQTAATTARVRAVR